MRIEFVCITANPERDVKVRKLPTKDVAGSQVDVPDWEIPVVVHEVDKLVHRFWTSLVGMRFCDFHLAREERCIGALEFVAHLDCEGDRTGVSAALRFGNLAAAAFSFPPVAFFDVAGVAVKLHPWASREIVLNVELAAAGDWTIHAKLHQRHPTPNVVVTFVDVESERRDLNRVFGDGRLVLAGGSGEYESDSDNRNGKHQGKLVHGRPPGFDQFLDKSPEVYYGPERSVKV